MTTPSNDAPKNDEKESATVTDATTVTKNDEKDSASAPDSGTNLSAMEAAVIEMMKNSNLQAQRHVGQQMMLRQQMGGGNGGGEGATKHAFWDTQVRTVTIGLY
jgi:hypothetical protein